METQQIKKEFRSRLIRQIIVAIVLLPAIFIFVAVRRGDAVALKEFLGLESSLILYGAIGLVVLGILFTLWNWRCPACKKYLKRDVYPKHCSGCGVEFHS